MSFYNSNLFHTVVNAINILIFTNLDHFYNHLKTVHGISVLKSLREREKERKRERERDLIDNVKFNMYIKTYNTLWS